MSFAFLQLKESQEEFVAHLTEAAYKIALKSRVEKTFIELELEIWCALKKIFKDNVNANSPTQLRYLIDHSFCQNQSKRLLDKQVNILLSSTLNTLLL